MRVEALVRRAHFGRIRGEADFLLRAHVSPVAHLGAPDFNGPNPGQDCAMRSMAVTHDAVSAIWQLQVYHWATKASASAISTWASMRRALSRATSVRDDR